MRPHRYTVLKKVENRINWQWMLKFETPAQFPLTFVSTSNFLRLFNWLSILVAIDFHSIQTHSHFATNFQHRIFSSTEGTTIVGNEIDCRTAVECKFDEKHSLCCWNDGRFKCFYFIWSNLENSFSFVCGVNVQSADSYLLPTIEIQRKDDLRIVALV